MLRQSFASGLTRDELEQQINDARQRKLVAETTFHQALRHYRRPEADQSSHEVTTKKKVEIKRFPTLEDLESRLANELVTYLERKVRLKEFEERLNAGGHQLDIARIDLHVDQLKHQKTLEDYGNSLRRCEAKIKAEKESHVRLKAHIEGIIEQRGLQYKQLEAQAQRIVNLRESQMKDLKMIVANGKDILAMREKLLRHSKRIAQHFRTMKAKRKNSIRKS